ncbi:MAG: hypothetical protein LBU04_03290 [Christensenellaceae bacterium]|nr:hypothetical protein [Christensenellaceae bacterium]
MEKLVKRLIYLLPVIAILAFCMFFSILFANNGQANADALDSITIEGAGGGSGAHAGGVVYYNSYTFTLTSPLKVGHRFQYSLVESEQIDAPTWIDFPENASSVTIYETVKNASISFRMVNGDGITVAESSYEHKIFIDSAPEITSFIEPESYFQTSYQVGFNLGVSYVGYTVVITDPTSTPTVISPGVTEFAVNENGNYIVTITSNTGAVRDAVYKATKIDTEIPAFTVVAPFEKGYNQVWGTVATYVILAHAIPVSGVRYWWSLDANSVDKVFAEDDEDTKCVISVYPKTNNDIIKFGAVSGSGVTYEYVAPSADIFKFIPWVDTEVPTIEVKQKGDPTILSREKVTLEITTSRNTSGVKVWYAIEGEPPVEHTKSQLEIFRPGIYRFYAVSGAGEVSDDFYVDVKNLDITLPELKLIVQDNDVTSQSVKIFNKNVKVSVKDLSSSKVTLNERELDAKFDDAGNITFTKSGFYTVFVYDLAGNESSVTFEIDKPNVALIVCLSILTAGAIGAFIWLILSNMKKAASIRRLVGNSTISDENNKFLMFKRIRKGGKKT